MTEATPIEYRPFPDVSRWTATGTIDTEEIDRLGVVVQSFEELPSEICQRAISAVRDAAAIETGAIENLYQLERGITITAAAEGAMASSALSGQPEEVRALITAQLQAYDFVMDFVTKAQPIAEAWIRSLHERLCSAQSHYKVRTTAGADEMRTLPLGQYKSEPNHVITQSGGTHFYAPVQDTAPEMRRLVDNLNSPAFNNLHPVDQAAYAHYGVVAIHPFPDGNGRMARALASVYSYRQYRVPLLITVDQKPAYFRVLEQADDGNFGPFRTFIRQRTADSIQLLGDSVRAARAGTPAEAISRIRELFQTRGQYSHVDVDHAGFSLLQSLQSELKKLIEDPNLATPGLHWSLGVNNGQRAPEDKHYRRPIAASTQLVQLRGQTASPAEAIVDFLIAVAVPKDARESDYFMLECGSERSNLTELIPVRNVLPERTMIADIALAIFARRLFGEMSAFIAAAARESLKKKGY